MKTSLLNGIAIATAVLVLGIGGPWAFRELRTLPGAGALAARADQRIVTLEVGGMTCGGCAATIQERLGDIAGVSTVEVRWQQRRAYVVCEKSVADTALTRAVDRAGPGFLGAVVTR